MKRSVCLLGHPVLRKKCREIKKEDYQDGLNELINDMFDTIKGTTGCGIAANQVGEPIRLFVIDGNSISDDYPECKGFKKVFINPKVTRKGKVECGYTERCLSLPGMTKEIERPERINIEYLDENFEYHKEKYDGIKARIIQHEYDHLEGKLLIDY